MDPIERLKKYKIKSGKTLEEIAYGITGVSFFTVQRWIRGQHEPSPIKMALLSQYLDRVKA